MTIVTDRATDLLDEYLRTALWTGQCYESEEDDNPEPLDLWADVEDVPEGVREALLADLEAFSMRVEDECPEAFDEMPHDRMVHDFHLTRNRHGAGFWDRGLGELGETLTRIAQSFGEAELMGHRQDSEIVDIWLA